MLNDKKLLIVGFYDIKNNKDLGEFYPGGQQIPELSAEIQRTIQDKILIDQSYYLPKYQMQSSSYRSFKLNWKLTKASILIVGVIHSNVDNDQIDTLMEEIETQNITKYLDKKGFINNVAKQNLQYIIDKNLDSRSSTASNSKIGSIKGDLDTIKTDMKKNIQNIVSNIEDSKVLDERASKIKDTSLIFKQNATELNRISKFRRYRNFIIVGAVLLVLFLIFYFIFS